MKREELKKTGLTDEQIESVMKMYGESINSVKTELEQVKADNTVKAKTIEEANKMIEGFKSVNVDEIKKSADEWKLKYEEAEKLKAQEIAKITKNSALEIELNKLNAKNPSLFRKALDESKIELKDGKLVGFDEQVKALKETDAYLFKDATPIRVGGNPTLPDSNNPLNDEDIKIRIAAGLPPTPKK